MIKIFASSFSAGSILVLFAIQTSVPVARFLETKVSAVNPFSLKSKTTLFDHCFQKDHYLIFS